MCMCICCIKTPLKRNSKPRNLLHKATVKQEHNQIVDPAEGCISSERKAVQTNARPLGQQDSTLNTEGESVGKGEEGGGPLRGGEVARGGEAGKAVAVGSRGWGRRGKMETQNTGREKGQN
jgi:hypothetical protein